MDRKQLWLNIGGNGKVVEDIGEVLPDHSIPILGLTLHVEPVVLSDRSGLMVPSDHWHSGWVFYFKQAQQSDHFYAMGSSVHKIA